MHLVIGANGRVGRLVAAELMKAGQNTRVLVRDADKAVQHFGSEVEVATGDLDNHASIQSAMAGITSVFLCCPVNPNQVTQQNGVVDAAVAAHAYLVKVSGLASFPGSFVDSGRWHAETESYLSDSGINYTCLHPYFFMQNMDFQLAGIKQDGVLKSAVESAAIAMVDARDIAAVATKLLINPDIAPKQTLPLTCNEALTYSQMAEQMAEVFGRPVTFQLQNMVEVEANLRHSKQPDWHVDIILQFNRAFAEGHGSRVHQHVQNILGRPPISFKEYLSTASMTEADSNPFPS